MKINFNFVMAAITFVCSVGLLIIFTSYAVARERAVVAEEKVRVLEEERIELEVQFEEAERDYMLLRDSLDEVHDSIAEIREGAKNRATESSLAFKENVSILRDSLEGYDGLGAILDTLTASHLRVVSAYQDQGASLEADKVLLWKRVEALDSMWIREQEINQALRNEIVALNEESDAWRRAANPNVLKRLRSGIPYLLVGAGAISLLN